MAECSCGRLPLVIVPGIGQSKVDRLDESGAVVCKAWPLDVDVNQIKKSLLPSAVRMVIFRHDLGFAAKARSAIEQALDTLRCNDDGSQKHRLRVVTYPSLAECTEDEKHFISRMVPLRGVVEKLGESHVYYAAFHPYGRAYENAALLDEYIQRVKRETGHDKVNLLPVSLGATVTTAYFDAFGEKRDVSRVVGIVPAYDGSKAVADILTGNVDIDNYEELFIGLLGRGDGGAVNKLLSLVPKKLVPKVITAMLEGARNAMLVNSPMMWGIMPAKDYPAVADRLISDEAHRALREVTDRAWRVRADFPAFIAEQRERGVEFFTLCGYNHRLFSETGRGMVNSDMIVPTASASMGCIAAPVNGSLGEDYVPARVSCADESHNHMSPDGAIDASAGALPETTWYFNGMDHEGSASCAPLMELVELLLTDPSPADVHTFPEYPQFMDFVKKDE